MTDSTKSAPFTPATAPRPSGRFVLRVGPELHAELRREAAVRGLSLNEHCARKLSEPPAIAVEHPELQAAVTRALHLLGEALAGVVVHGSWARGETHDGSDVDLLLVVAEGTPIDRELYRRWDAEGALTIDGRRADAHFARLPASGERVTPFWAEIATDGFVAFERERRVSLRLARIRGQIAAGRLVRRTVHGQPYWTEVT
jgi:predicted nucleotidyltransferase